MKKANKIHHNRKNKIPNSENKLVVWVKHNKLKAGIYVGIILTLIIVFVVFLIFILNNNICKSDNDAAFANEPVVTEPEIDYNQEITSENGEVFNPNYELGSETNFSAHFVNLECDEQCDNVMDLKIGEKTLERDKDYEVKKGSVIIIIYADTLKNLELGEYETTFQITNDNKKAIIGFKIIIEDNIPTCSESQVLENNQCIDKQEEQISQQSQPTQSTQPAQSVPAQPSTATDAAGVPLVDYSTGVPAYMIPDNHVISSRAAFTANGGWEQSVFWEYSNYLMDLKNYGKVVYAGGGDHLCLTSFEVDFTTMTVSNPHWNDAMTPTCDYLRNEHPPVPSAEYLTSLLRKIHASDCYLNDVNWMYCRNPQW